MLDRSILSATLSLFGSLQEKAGSSIYQRDSEGKIVKLEKKANK